MKIVTVAEMRRLEELSVANGISTEQLMESAGLGAARRIAQFLNGPRGKRVLILVGPGNNGGDGLVVARFLSDWGSLVTLYLVGGRRAGDSNYEECLSRRMRIIESGNGDDNFALSSYLSLADVVVDAILGIGQKLPLKENFAEVCSTLKEVRAQRTDLSFIALDTPTGVDAQTGEIDSNCSSADMTLTFGAPKVGLFKFPAASQMGRLEVVDIGLPLHADNHIALELADDQMIKRVLPSRALDSHKGSFGHVVVVGGSTKFVGAPILTCKAAYRSGAGLITLATPLSVYKLAATQITEAIHHPMEETESGHASHKAASSIVQILANSDSAVIGPGLGQSESIQEFIKQILLVEGPANCPLVIDADAINVLANIPRWWDRLNFPSILTPHPAEMSRLLNENIAVVQQDRVEIAQRAAEKWGKVVVLKGAHTVIAAPDGRTCLSPFANPILASAGTGDVLSGIIGGMLAQGCDIYAAAIAGVYIHAMAGERISKTLGASGLLASDILYEIPQSMHFLRNI